MPPLRLQFVGNLFVDRSYDHFSKFVLSNHSPYVALLGNIGSPFSPRTHEFLDYCSQSWDRVFWIPGPHELGYSSNYPSYTSFRDNLDCMENLAARKKSLTILNQGSTTIENVQIVGASLWTPVHPYRVEGKYQQPEFYQIQKYGTTKLSPIDLSDWHSEDISFVKEKLETNTPTIVLTHHLPHPSLLSPSLGIRTWKRNGLESTNLTSLLRHPCKLWLSGASGGSAIGLFQQFTLAMVNSLYEYPHRRSEGKNPYFSPRLYAELNKLPPFSYAVAHGVPPQQKFSELR